MIEHIKIMKVGRKQQPSKFKPGETYSITTIMDEKNRKLVAMGGWGDKWKEGDEVDVIIEEKKWTDKDGFDQVSLNLKNPDQKQFTPRTGGGGFLNNTVISYQLAASLAPLFFSDKKKISLADVDKLAEELKKRIDVVPANTVAEKKDDTPIIDVNKDEKKEVTKTVVEDDDDDKPF